MTLFCTLLPWATCMTTHPTPCQQQSITCRDKRCWWEDAHLLIDLNGFLVLLQLRCVSRYFQKALVCWTEKEKQDVSQAAQIQKYRGSKTTKRLHCTIMTQWFIRHKHKSMKTSHAVSFTVQSPGGFLPFVIISCLFIMSNGLEWEKRREHETVVLQTHNQEAFMWQIKTTVITYIYHIMDSLFQIIHYYCSITCCRCDEQGLVWRTEQSEYIWTVTVSKRRWKWQSEKETQIFH